jgi:predicted RNA binding protein YcfA (HicA-like mRNA interferase family)
MSKIPAHTPKDLVKILQYNGFSLDRSRGIHQVWIHPISRKRVVVPMKNKSLPAGTMYTILKQAGIYKNKL